ncbi:MAG: chromosomal replication initiator protein DnaA [Chlamydiae bacterium RIFCSPLOWO2_02_FULL_49_12]|nr:MAG: chromosomal replication initiator protein DnaA [Chlamydiae bacterium RIFCSPLOWO2_02_FULL_49_12]
MQAWDQFLNELERELGQKTVQKWLRTLKVVHFDACNLYLEAPDAFQMLWFEEHIRKKASRSLKNNNFRPIKVHLTASGSDSRIKEKRGRKVTKEIKSDEPFYIASDPLDVKSSFDTYLISEENSYPLQFLKQLTSLGRLASFNPLYLLGEKGSGKTHLLMALCVALKEKGHAVHFVHTESFTEHFISAIRLGKMEQFRHAYRTIDVLILDDIHLLARRNATQEELFHTFNALHSRGKQIILASSLSPSQLQDIEPRLVSRFEWGLLLTLKPLSLPKRRELLSLRASNAHFPLPDEIADLLLSSFPNVESLLVAFDALILRSEEQQKSFQDRESAERLLKDLLAQENEKRLTPEKIIISVAHAFDLQKEELMGRAQTKECSLPRQLAMYLCRKELKRSFKEIGRIFHRDHSTVISGIRKIQKKLDKQDAFLSTSLSQVQKWLKPS